MTRYVNYPRWNLLFATLLMGSLVLDIGYGISGYVYLLLYLMYSALFFYGVFSINSQFFMPVYCSVSTQKPVIALSFDDGPSDYTADILTILNDFDVKATFFCIGKRITSSPALVKQLHQHGHLIGNHSYSHHVLFDIFWPNTMLQELRLTDEIITDIIGIRPRLFRPPFGVINPALASAIRKHQSTPIGWSIRSLDTLIKDEQQLLNNCIAALHPGAIILMHDTQAVTRAILPAFIQAAHAKGYEIIRVDELLGIPAYQEV